VSLFRICVTADLKIAAITANFGNERARFMSDIGYRQRDMGCIRLPAFIGMGRGARCDHNEGDSDRRYEKVMLTVIWGTDGFHVVDMMRPGVFQHRVLSYSYYGSFVRESPSRGREKPSTSTECPLRQLPDSFFECVKIFFDENSVVIIPHPSYSPDLAPSDFCVCGHIKTSFTGRVFNDVDELLEAVIEFVNEIQLSELQLVFVH
jgi:hypothetical protein